jgi:hypothetical protein
VRRFALILGALALAAAPATAAPKRPGSPLGLRASGFRFLGSTCSAFSYTGTPLYQSLALTDTWTPGANTLTTNAVFSPACATTGAKLIENTATSAHTGQKTVDFAITAAVHTLTLFYQPVGARSIGVEIDDSSFASGSHVDVSSACVVTNNYVFGTRFSGNSASVSTVNGWCKIVLNTTYATSDTEISIFISNTNAGSTNYAGDGVSGVALWGVDFR